MDSFEFQIIFRGIFSLYFVYLFLNCMQFTEKKHKFYTIATTFCRAISENEESFNSSLIESWIIQHQLSRQMLHIDFINRNNCRQPWNTTKT